MHDYKSEQDSYRNYEEILRSIKKSVQIARETNMVFYNMLTTELNYWLKLLKAVLSVSKQLPDGRSGSKVPILLYFVKPKRPSGNCY